MDGPASLCQRMEILQNGLAEATAEDFRHATRRRLLPISEIAVFIDGYHRVERSAEPDFIVSFAKRLAELGALRVVLVVACREQERWTKLADAQPDCEDFGIMKVSRRVQIHHLQPIGWADRVHALQRYGAPPSLVNRLADLSAGVPLALSMLGAAFGAVGPARQRSQLLLDELPDPVRADGAWFERFTRVMAREMLAGLDRDLKLHLRAAATQRNFDRPLIAACSATASRTRPSTIWSPASSSEPPDRPPC